MTPTSTEENYLKAVLKLSSGKGLEATEQAVSTNAIAAELSTTPASVTDMVKRLNDKGLLTHVPYKGVQLTPAGRSLALQTVRKHRLWEVFLVDKLHFSWDEVHDTAEQLEHVRSPKLVEALDAFLGHPKFDPHGDPIPDADGQLQPRAAVPLAGVSAGLRVTICGVAHTSPEFLRYLDRLGLQLNTNAHVVEHIPFDNSRLLRLPDGREVIVSSAVTDNLLVIVNS